MTKITIQDLIKVQLVLDRNLYQQLANYAVRCSREEERRVSNSEVARKAIKKFLKEETKSNKSS